MTNDDSKTPLQDRVQALKSEHRALDGVIAQLVETAPYDQLQLKRMKKRKLALKDEITALQSRILPDIIA